MKVVIDIPEKMYTSLELGSFGMKYNVYDLAGCVMHGTPLPTGHGELKDTDNIKKEILCRKYSASFCEEHHIDHSINAEIALSIIDNAPTIIKASKDFIKMVTNAEEAEEYPIADKEEVNRNDRNNMYS